MLKTYRNKAIIHTATDMHFPELPIESNYLITAFVPIVQIGSENKQTG